MIHIEPFEVSCISHAVWANHAGNISVRNKLSRTNLNVLHEPSIIILPLYLSGKNLFPQ